MTLSAYRLIHRVEPFRHEDVIGFLMRVAERNHAGGPADLLSQITGSPNNSIQTRDLPKLAHYCRNTIDEVAQLSGVVQIMHGNAQAWHVAGEWVTKSSFVAVRRAKICPRCLLANTYIRGQWCLTLCTACAEHGVRLVSRCPACQRTLKWNRRRVGYCGCGFNLGNAPVVRCTDSEALMARLIFDRANEQVTLLGISSSLPVIQIEFLARLSLEGILKTIWFLGHCIGDMGFYGTGHGKSQPAIDTAARMIERAFELMNAWPDRLSEHLLALAQRTPSKSSASILDRLLGPAQHYVQEEMNTTELAGVKATYEQIIQMIWRNLGRRMRSSGARGQLELRFD